MMYWLMIGVALFGVAVSAQYTEIPAKSGPASLVFPGPGDPVVLEQIEERSRKLDGEALEVEAIRSKVYRNSSGKLRIDSDEGDVNSGGLAQTISHIIDPSTGVRLILLSAAKSGYRWRDRVRRWVCKPRGLGARIKRLREEAGESQEDMLSHGYSVRYWQKVEAGKPITLRTLLRICRIFSTPMCDVVRGLDRNPKTGSRRSR
jgi:hypothetical protein